MPSLRASSVFMCAHQKVPTVKNNRWESLMMKLFIETVNVRVGVRVTSTYGEAIRSKQTFDSIDRVNKIDVCLKGRQTRAVEGVYSLILS